MQSPSSPPSWIAPLKKPAAGGGLGRLERSLAALPWSQRLLVGRRSLLAWGLGAGSVKKGSHWAVCSKKLAWKGASRRRVLVCGLLGEVPGCPVLVPEATCGLELATLVQGLEVWFCAERLSLGGLL